MKILDLCEAERPREKMMQKGSAALSNGELLAILLRTGTKGESALELAQRLLSLVEGSLTRLFCMGAIELKGVKGMGESRAAAVLAALELGKRFLLEESSMVKTPIISSRMVYDMMIPVMKGVLHEENWAIFLNNASYVIGKEKVTIGNGNATVIDYRQIIKSALDRGASALVMVHNHPSGNPRPSPADVRETKAMRTALNGVGLYLNDHVIISDDRFYSFADDRLYGG